MNAYIDKDLHLLLVFWNVHLQQIALLVTGDRKKKPFRNKSKNKKNISIITVCILKNISFLNFWFITNNVKEFEKCQKRICKIIIFYFFRKICQSLLNVFFFFLADLTEIFSHFRIDKKLNVFERKNTAENF